METRNTGCPRVLGGGGSINQSHRETNRAVKFRERWAGQRDEEKVTQPEKDILFFTVLILSQVMVNDSVSYIHTVTCKSKM